MQKDNTNQKEIVDKVIYWTELKEKLLCAGGLEEKATIIVQGVVDILETDAAGLWISRPGDRCQSECRYMKDGTCVCQDQCLHFITGFGKDTDIEGILGRIPLGYGKIGKIASGEIQGLYTNDLQNDPEIGALRLDSRQNMKAFCGYRLLSSEALPNGVLATFSTHNISNNEAITLNTIAATAAHFVQTTLARERLERRNEQLENEVQERKKDKVELLKWAQIFNNASVGIITSTSDGLHVDKANPAFAEMHGYDVGELEGMEMLQFIAPEYRDKIPAIVKEARKSKKIEVETKGFRKDGSTFPLMGNVTDVNDKNGRLLYRIVSGQDMSERQEANRRHRKLEDRIFRVQKMESLGTLASGIAHDFNNILAIIMIQNELAQRKLANGKPFESHLGKIVQASERAKKLVKQILSFSRRVNQDQEPVWIDLIVKESLKLLRATLPSTIDIRSQIDPEISAVMCDATQIHQIVMNLCTNAGYAMRDKQCGLMEVCLNDGILHQKGMDFFPDLKPGKCVQLIVKDNGVGMDEEVRERIFDPYFTTKPKGEGTGLGLSVIHGIMSRLGGAITVHSQPDQGTEFRVYFPCTSKTVKGQEVPPDLPASGDETVLFLDDETEIVLAAEEMLGDFGYRVTGTSSPDEALQMVEKDPPRFDIVITDQTMPGITGIELARRIEAIRSDLPVILCTGYNEKIGKTDDQSGIIRAFLKKPFEMLQAAQTIRKIID